jgi:predicted Zn-dependent protease
MTRELLVRRFRYTRGVMTPLRELGGLVLVVALALAAPAARANARSDQLLKDGDAQVLLGDDAAAAQLYREALAADPGDAQATVRLAFLESRAGHDDDAAKRLEELVARPDAPPEAAQILGAVRAKQRQWKAAVAAFDAYLARVPHDYRARRELARALAGSAAESNDAAARGRAVSEYEKALADAGDDDSFRSSSTEELFALRYGASGKAYLDGRTAYASGDYRGAVAKLEAVTREHPEIQEAHFVLGMAYTTPEIGRRADGLAQLALAPSLKEAQLHLGMELQADGDLDAAAARVNMAINLDHDYQEAWYYLGLIAAEQGKTDDALAAWEHAARIDPTSETGKWAATKYSVVGGRGADSGVFQEGQVVDPATEVAIGQKLEDMIVEYLGGRVDDERLAARLDRIFARLVVATDRGDIHYSLIVVASSDVNAFTAPGGRVFVTRGLVDAVRTRMGDEEAFYAAVLGHELAHAALRHTPERWKYVQTVINDARATRDAQEHALGQVMTGMTRQSEYEADQYGALYMYRAGYNPRYAMTLHQQFRKAFGEIPAGLDHPTFEDREARLKDFLIELRGRVREFERGNKKLRDGDYAGAARSYEIFLAVLPKNAPGHLNLALARHRQALARLGAESKYKRSTDLDPDARAAAIELHSAGPAPRPDPRIDQALMREAAAEYRTALRLDPDYVLARVDYGAWLLDQGDVKNATKMLERAVQLAPRAAMAWNNLGVAYAMAKDAKKATEALEKAGQLDAKLADPWFNLGVVWAEAGQKAKAVGAFEQYAVRDRDSGWAKKAQRKKAELATK